MPGRLSSESAVVCDLCWGGECTTPSLLPGGSEALPGGPPGSRPVHLPYRCRDTQVDRHTGTQTYQSGCSRNTNAPQPHLPLKGILRKSQGGHIYTQFCLFLFSQTSLIPPRGKKVLLFFTDIKSMQAQGVSKMSCNSKPASSFLFFFWMKS